MAQVASRAFFSVEIIVILRNRRFIHRRPEVGRVRQVLRIRVIRQKAESIRVTAAYIDVASVVPALCGVLQQIDRANRKSLALDYRIRATKRQSSVRHKSKRFKWT